MLHFRSTKGYSEELSKKIGEDFEKQMPSSKTYAPSARAFPRSSATSPRLAKGDPSPRRSAPAQDRSWTKALGNCWRRTSKSDHRCVATRLLHRLRTNVVDDARRSQTLAKLPDKRFLSDGEFDFR